jgi:acetyl-CoA C-acetyltransferase
VRHEAACASGSMAVLAAMAELEAGRRDVALVLGVELMRNRSGFEAQALLKAAALVPDETEGVTYPWAEQFARIQEAYERAYGVDTSPALRALARENFRRARENPLAQTRSWTLDDACFSADDEKNPKVAGKLRKHDCSQISDGYAALLLVSGRWLAERGSMFGVRPQKLAHIQGFGHRGSPIALASKLRAPCDADGFLGHVRRTVLDAYARAGSRGDDIDVAEVHDCFSISQLLAIEALGLAAPGQAVHAVEAGRVFAGGASVLNPSGGLMGVGHPVGATGVRMVLDAARQVTGEAGAAQVEGARRAATLNIGGSTATVASFVLGRST